MCLAMPKSSTFSRIAPLGVRVRKRFSGLMSRCTTPRACAAESAPRSCRPISSTSRVGGRSAMRSESSSPSSSSMTKKSAPSRSSPASSTRTTEECAMDVVARTSRAKRATCPSDVRRCSCRISDRDPLAMLHVARFVHGAARAVAEQPRQLVLPRHQLAEPAHRPLAAGYGADIAVERGGRRLLRPRVGIGPPVFMCAHRASAAVCMLRTDTGARTFRPFIVKRDPSPLQSRAGDASTRAARRMGVRRDGPASMAKCSPALDSRPPYALAVTSSARR